MAVPAAGLCQLRSGVPVQKAEEKEYEWWKGVPTNSNAYRSAQHGRTQTKEGVHGGWRERDRRLGTVTTRAVKFKKVQPTASKLTRKWKMVSEISVILHCNVKKRKKNVAKNIAVHVHEKIAIQCDSKSI